MGILNKIKQIKDKLIFKVVIWIISVWIFGSLLISFIEPGSFKNIWNSLWWTIVTMTTVGYGDISPVTNIGQFIAAIIMIMGYSIIAVPTGIVTSSMNFTKDNYTKTCIVCNDDRQSRLAKYCNQCGAVMPEEE